MQKLIIATDTWHPHIDGVVRSIDELSRRLKDKGFEIIILHPRLFLNIPLPFYPEYRFTFFSGIGIKKIIANEKPNYIHIATWGPVGLAVRNICLKQKINFTTSYPTHFPQYTKNYLIKSGVIFNITYNYLRWFHNAGGKTMVSTESLKQESEKYGFKNVAIWPLGVDMKLFQRNISSLIKKKYNLNSPVFVYFGRVAKEKNVEEFLKLKLPGTKLVIGDGPLRKKMEKKYRSSSVFVGYKKGQDLVDWLSICDVFVFTSRTDTFGLTIIEALACGIPVAAHNVMGPKDIITNGVDGFLDENLQNAALKCLNISREKCREKALKFSWESSVEAFINNLVKIK